MVVSTVEHIQGLHFNLEPINLQCTPYFNSSKIRHYWIQALCRVPNTLPSAKPLSSAALGKEPPVKNPSAKNSLPSAFYRALGKVFAECPTLGKVGTEKKPEKNGKKWNFF